MYFSSMKKLVLNLLLLLAGIPAAGQTLGGLKPGILLSSKGFHAFATRPLEAHRYWHPWSSTYRGGAAHMRNTIPAPLARQLGHPDWRAVFCGSI